MSESLPNHEILYPQPEIVPLYEQVVQLADTDFHLPYEGIICQSEYRAIDMSFTPSAEEFRILLEERGLTPDDKSKYIGIVKRLIEEKRIALEIGPESSLQDILSFCTAAMWIITGAHNEQVTNDQLMRTHHITASELVDIDNPPVTKCSFFNSAFAYLFEAACTYSKKKDLLKKYQLIAVKNIPTHLYLALVSQKDKHVRISAIDPYHTGLRDDIVGTTMSSRELFAKLDQTQQRGHALNEAYWNAINWDTVETTL